MITKDIVEALGTCLKDLIHNMQECCIFNTQCFDTIAALESTIGDIKSNTLMAKSQIRTAEKEVNEMIKTFNALNKLNEFDINDIENEDEITTYTTAQSMVASCDNSNNMILMKRLKQKYEVGFKSIKDHLFNKDDIKKVEKVIKKEPERKNEEELKGEDNLMEEIDIKSLSLSYKEVKNDLILKLNDKLVPLSLIELDKDNEQETAKNLANAEKFCEKCKKFSKYSLILECHCVICIKCLQEYIKKKNNGIINNVFEAKERKESVLCACPKHEIPIRIPILLGIFGKNKIEEASINSLKRQLLTGTEDDKISFFICPGCNTLIKKFKHSCEITRDFHKLRVCKECYE